MNIKQNLKSVAGILVVTAILLAISVATALASPPPNDNFANATVIINLPYSDSTNTSEASIESSDPVTCVGQYGSIWYTYIPESDANLRISTNTDYGYSVTLSIYREENGGLTEITCNDWQSGYTDIEVNAGEVYYFELMARYVGGLPYPPPDSDGGNVTINIVQFTPPANDDFTNATIIQGTTYSDYVDTTFASTEEAEPFTCGWTLQKTLWYSYTPEESGLYAIQSTGGWYQTLAAYTGSDLSSLQNIGCSTDWMSQLTLILEAGTTYHFQTYSNSSDTTYTTFNLMQVFRPSNDDFANATVVQEIPYSNTVDLTYASLEPDEPQGCFPWNFGNTIWYIFTPTTSGSYTAETTGGYEPGLNVYRGSYFSDLQTIACGMGYWEPSRATAWLEAGTTYYFQLYLWNNYWGSSTGLYLYPTPPPEAHIEYWPIDPYKNENVQFSNDSYDPYNMGFQTCTWDFGDGGTATDCYPVHAFVADGDYTVQLSVTTLDGRIASTTQVVQVRTHDAGITRLVAPTSARVGQTKSIAVHVKNLYYPELLQIDLYKMTQNGDELVGTVTQTVPVRPVNRAQVFNFDYTFTSEDAYIGKATFKAVVTIIDARDVFPSDNEVVSIATRVTR